MQDRKFISLTIGHRTPVNCQRNEADTFIKDHAKNLNLVPFGTAVILEHEYSV